MNPSVETSVHAFSSVEKRSRRHPITFEDVERAVRQSAEEIKIKWLISHAQSHKVCARTRLLHAAAVSGLSDNAFRVLFLQLSFTNGTDLKTIVDNETIAILAGCNEKTVRRSNKQLEDEGWVTVKRRRRDSAEKTMAIPEAILAQIGTEIMENLPHHIASTASDQDRTKMSTQEVLSGCNVNQDRTKMSTQDEFWTPQEWTEMSGQEILPGENEDQDRTKMSTLEPHNRENSNLRPDKNVHLICIKEKTRKNKKGAESDCIQSARTLEQAPPPRVEKISGYVGKVASAVLAGLAGAAPVAAAPVEPPAIVQPAPEIPECWSTPQARQNAALRPAEAKAQREVLVTPDGRLEASGAFRAELATTFPLVDLTGGLLASAVNVRPYMTAIEVMQVVRRQFVYLQGDAKRKQDREQALNALYAAKHAAANGKTPAGYDENGVPYFRSRS